MAKHTLNSNDEDLDFEAISITCAEELYTTVALIDAALGIELQLAEHIAFTLKADKLFRFALFQHVDEDLGIEYNLIPNLSNFEAGTEMTAGNDLFSQEKVEERTRLIRELPRTDYFLILKGAGTSHAALQMMDLLRRCPELTQVNQITVLDLPSRRNLIF
jgi:hypothetical protein